MSDPIPVSPTDISHSPVFYPEGTEILTDKGFVYRLTNGTWIVIKRPSKETPTP